MFVFFQAELKSAGKVKTFIFSSNVAIIFTEDLKKFLLSYGNPDKDTVRFINEILHLISEREIEKSELKKNYKLTDNNIV